MLSRRMVLSGTVFGLAAGAAGFWRAGSLQAGSLLAEDTAAADTAKETFAVTHSEAEWRQLLNADQYAVLREAATEQPFSSPLLHEERRGNFDCAGCDLALFSSTTKFDSGTGWPSFWAPLDKAVGTTRDTTFGMVRTAVHCSRCGGHLGHVFDDGPPPTGLRYCMNGLAMTFKPVAA